MDVDSKNKSGETGHPITEGETAGEPEFKRLKSIGLPGEVVTNEPSPISQKKRPKNDLSKDSSRLKTDVSRDPRASLGSNSSGLSDVFIYPSPRPRKKKKCRCCKECLSVTAGICVLCFICCWMLIAQCYKCLCCHYCSCSKHVDDTDEEYESTYEEDEDIERF